MSTPQERQHKLGSGFGVRSTADEVLRGIDLGGKRALVTGGASGIGLETTRALRKAGATVVVAARNVTQATDALRGIDGVEVGELDLSDQQSVRRFAEWFMARGEKLDLLINNAGVMACPETRVGNGWELQFATNHLGHFTLTNLLWPALNARARVVELSSMGHQSSPIRWDDLFFTRDRYSKWKAYGQSKTANSLFAVQLDALGRAEGIRAFAVHPGGIATPLQRHVARDEQLKLGWIDERGQVANPAFKTPEQGAATTCWVATSPKLEGLGGLYCEDCDVSDFAPEGKQVDLSTGGVRWHAIDPEAAARLWALSAELTGVDAFAPAASSSRSRATSL